MAISRLGDASTNLDSATSGSLSISDLSHSSGDLLLVLVSIDGTNGLDTPTGFTQEDSDRVVGTHTNQIFSKISDGTETSIGLNVSSGERAWICCIAITGVDKTDPVGQISYNGSSSTGTTATFTALTPAQDDSMVVAFVGLESGNSGAAVVTTWPSTFTERNDNVNGPPGGGSASSSGAYADVIQSSATEVSGTTSLAGGSTHWGAFFIEIVPPSGPQASADQTLSIGQSANAAVEVQTNATQSLDIGQSANATVPSLDSTARFGGIGAPIGAPIGGLLGEAEQSITTSADQTLFIGQDANAAVGVKASARQTLEIGQSANAGVEVQASAAQSLEIGQTANAEALAKASAAQPLEIGQSANAIHLAQTNAAQSLQIVQTASAAVEVKASADQTLNIGQFTDAIHLSQASAVQTLEIGQSANAIAPIQAAAVQTLGIGQSADASRISALSSVQSLSIGQTIVVQGFGAWFEQTQETDPFSEQSERSDTWVEQSQEMDAFADQAEELSIWVEQSQTGDSWSAQ